MTQPLKGEARKEERKVGACEKGEEGVAAARAKKDKRGSQKRKEKRRKEKREREKEVMLW